MAIEQSSEVSAPPETQPVLSSATFATINCPRCQTTCRVGELICPQCNSLLSAAGNTRLLGSTASSSAGGSSNNAFGMVFIESQKQITFAMQEKTLVLPVAETLIIGRLDEDGQASQVSQPSQPDISLNEFGAATCGVSRQHIKITRQRDLIYVTDMGSRNGTFINNRHIHPHTKHILRSGDELRLGHLIVHVSF